MRTAILLGLVGVLAGSSAAANELAGTYAGEFSCQLTGGRISAVPTMLTISERGSGSTAEIDGVRYGILAADGDAALRACGSINPQYGEANGAEDIRYGVDPATGATVVRLALRSEIGVCSATWTRIDARDPGVPACGE